MHLSGIHLIILQTSNKIEKGKNMSKLELMEKFMYTFVGNGFHLVIRERENGFLVHTIEIMQKVDESCPVKEILMDDYFLHLIAKNQHGEEASIVCNWSQKLLENLLENYKTAKEAGRTCIKMSRNPMTNDPNDWILSWGGIEEQAETRQITYIS